MGIFDLFSVRGWHTRRGVPGVHPDPRLLGLRRIFYRRKGINRYYSYVYAAYFHGFAFECICIIFILETMPSYLTESFTASLRD